MSRYIDADALFESLGRKYLGAVGNPTWDDIYSAPSIEIIRCRECKWSEPNEFGDLDCKCHIPTFRTTEDGYCWRAERRVDE